MKSYPNKYPVCRVIGAALMAVGGAGLSGCGLFKHTSADTIPTCPAHYATASVEVNDVPASHAAMQQGVRTFLADVPSNAILSDGTIAAGALDSTQQSAAPALMHGFEPAFSSNLLYDPGKPNVGSLGQEFCDDSGQTYASPAYEAARAALQVAGITVQLNPAAVTTVPPSTVQP